MWLAIAGGLVLVVMVAHSTWTSRQNQPKQAEPFLTPDELMALDIAPADNDSPHQDNSLLDSPFQANVSERNVSTQLDALIDVIATIELDAPVSGEAAIAALPAIRRVGNKLFVVEGLNADNGN